jgi:hypothetical protein
MGPGVIPYQVAPNSGSSALPRTGWVRAGDQRVPVLQKAENLPQLFADVSLTHPFIDHITLLARAGVTSGCAAGRYCPDAMISRGQTAVFLARALIGDSFLFEGNALFSDVPPAHPYFRYVQKLAELRIMFGCSGSTYCTDSPVTRGEFAEILVRAALSVPALRPFPYPGVPYFTDVPATHRYFSSVQKMRQLGITSGCSASAYCVDAPVTRGQASVFVVRALLTP